MSPRGGRAMLPAAALLGALAVGAAAAQPAPAEREFSPVTELRQEPTGARFGGLAAEVSDPHAWPATFRSEFTENGQRNVCSATLLAPRVLLTAAHCVPERRVTLTARVGSGALRWRGRCDVPTAYPADPSADLALCLMEAANAIRVEAHEWLQLDAAGIAPGRDLWLAGYGCRQIGGVADGRMFEGRAPLAILPPQVVLAGHAMPNWAATPPVNVAGSPYGWLCEGDSGAGTYLWVTQSSRRLVAVASARDGAGTGVSYFSALWTPAARAFIEAWARRNDQRLCGVHNDAQDCR